MPELTTRQLVAWLTSITRPVHRPLYVSTAMRIIHLVSDIALFAVACGGMVAVVQGLWQPLSWIVTLVVVAVVKATSFYLEQFTGHYVAFKALELLRTHAFAQLWPKAPAVVTRARTGDMLASLTRDVDRIEVVYAHTFAPVVAAVVAPSIALLVGGFTVGWRVVAFPALVIVALIAVLLGFGTRTSLRLTHRVMELRRAAAAHVTDSVFGAAEIVGYGRQEQRHRELAAIDREIDRTSRRVRWFVGVRRMACVAAVVGIAASLVAVGMHVGLSLSVIAALVGASLRIVEGPRGIEDAVAYLDHSLAAARRLWYICHTPPSVEDGPEVLLLDHAPSVAWRDVSFAYRNESGQPLPQTIEDVTASVPAGGHLVVRGPSGSGKTTLVHLLLRHYDPDEGEVLLDGVPVTRYTLDSLRRAVAVVSQRVELLNASIADNLRLGRPEATDEELWRVLRAVAMADEVRALDAGLQHVVGPHGSRLSGGQAQRLTVARAILMRPRVVVLDEFTASVDTALAEELRRRLTAALPDVTIIEITHVDEPVGQEVVYIDGGRVVNDPEEFSGGQPGATRRRTRPIQRQ